MRRRLMRDGRHAVVGGVAAGFGEYLDVDPVLVRLAFVLLAFANGVGVLVYLAAWALMPRREAVLAAADPAAASAAGASAANPAFDPAAGSAFDEMRAAGARAAADARAALGDAASAQAAVGVLLALFGLVLLAHNLDWLRWPWWLRFDTLWPALLVALGLGLIAKSRKRGQVLN